MPSQCPTLNEHLCIEYGQNCYWNDKPVLDQNGTVLFNQSCDNLYSWSGLVVDNERVIWKYEDSYSALDTVLFENQGW